MFKATLSGALIAMLAACAAEAPQGPPVAVKRSGERSIDPGESAVGNTGVYGSRSANIARCNERLGIERERCLNEQSGASTGSGGPGATTTR